MKNLILILFVSLSTGFFAQAQDVYICETVLFCNEAGRCVEIEICDIVESVVIDDFRNNFEGSFTLKSSSLRLKGFSKKAEGRIVIIKDKTIIKAPKENKAAQKLVGQAIMPGKYQINKGRLDLKVGRK